MNLKKPELGYQLSSITPYLQNVETIRSSLNRIAEIGYEYVQLQGIPSEIKDADIAAALRESGLKCVATQEDCPLGFFANPERAVERAANCGAETLVFALIPRENYSVEGLSRFADTIQKIHELCKSCGLKLAFHPIRADFSLMEGIPVYRRVLELLPEIGLTFCVSASFESPVSCQDVFLHYGNRIDLVHFKDYITNSEGRQILTPLGEGSHDWQDIYRLCVEHQVKYIFAEQERWEKDAFACAEISLAYLKALE